MADTVSSGDPRPSSKRRRVLNPSAIVPVPVYSGRVSSGLQLKPAACLLADKESSDEGAGESLWAEFHPRKPPAALVELSDSEDDSEPRRSEAGREAPGCPSPPPAGSPAQKQSSRARRKISEINRTLRAVSSVLSPEPEDSGSGRRRARRSRPAAPDDDTSPTDGADPLREIPLKIRCRTDVHKVLVLPSTRLGDVLGRLSVLLEVPPPRLLLLKEELELPADATVGQLGLGIADIIECVVMSAEEQSSITVKLQSKDRDSSQEFSIHREAPLSSVFSQYLSSLPAAAHRKVRFHFDGSKVTGSQTPAQLDLEDGDIIEVWT
ncbi:NFATC2-interacting protein [Anableps anableps]